MKLTFALMSLFSVLFAGCGQPLDSPAKSDSSATNSVAGPADYLKSAAKSQKSAIKVVDATALNKALELFYVQEGRFPKDLNELVDKKFIPAIPPAPVGMKITYDDKAGIVQLERE